MNVLLNPIVLAATGAVFFVMAAFIGTSVYLPVYFEGLLHLAPSQAGFGLIPLMMGTVLGAAISGKISAQITHYKRLAMSGLAIATICILFLGFQTNRLSFAAVAGIVAIAGAGVGTLFPIATVSVQNAVEQANLGVATATLTFLRSLGGAIGVAVLGSVFLSHGIAIQSIESGHQFSAVADHALPNAFVLVFFLAAGFLLAGQGCVILMHEKAWRSARDTPRSEREKETDQGVLNPDS
jgi:MFS family permease